MIYESEHSLDEFVDQVFSVSEVTSVLESMSFGNEATSGASKLERPHGVVNFFEVSSTSE